MSDAVSMVLWGWDTGPTFDGPLPQDQLDTPFHGQPLNIHTYPLAKKSYYKNCRAFAESKAFIEMGKYFYISLKSFGQTMQ